MLDVGRGSDLAEFIDARTLDGDVDEGEAVVYDQTGDLAVGETFRGDFGRRDFLGVYVGVMRVADGEAHLAHDAPFRAVVSGLPVGQSRRLTGVRFQLVGRSFPEAEPLEFTSLSERFL